MFGDAVGCDVGDGLAAGYGESVAGALVSVGFTEQILPVAVPFAGAVGEHDLHLVPAGVRDLVGHPSAAGFRHVRMDDFAVDAVGHHCLLPRGGGLVVHRHRLLLRGLHGQLDRGLHIAGLGGDRRGAGLLRRDHAGAHHRGDGRIGRRPGDAGVRGGIGRDHSLQRRIFTHLQAQLAILHTVTGDRQGIDLDHARAHRADRAIFLNDEHSTGTCVVLVDAAVVVPVALAVVEHELNLFLVHVRDGVANPAVAGCGHLHARGGGPGAVRAHTVVQAGGVGAELGARVEDRGDLRHVLLAGHGHGNGGALAAGGCGDRGGTLLHEGHQTGRINGGRGRVGGLPRHLLVGGVGRLHGGAQLCGGITVSQISGQFAVLHAIAGDVHRLHLHGVVAAGRLRAAETGEVHDEIVQIGLLEAVVLLGASGII